MAKSVAKKAATKTAKKSNKTVKANKAVAPVATAKSAEPATRRANQIDEQARRRGYRRFSTTRWLRHSFDGCVEDCRTCGI